MITPDVVDEILRTDINEAVVKYANEINAASLILYNINCGNCENKRAEIYLRLFRDRDTIKDKLTKIMERNYELSEDVVLTVPELGLTVTNNNLTDEIAKKILEYNPAFKGQFTKMPAPEKETKTGDIKETKPKTAPKKTAQKQAK